MTGARRGIMLSANRGHWRRSRIAFSPQTAGRRYPRRRSAATSTASSDHCLLVAVYAWTTTTIRNLSQEASPWSVKDLLL
jgi:hypothetical protein